MTEWLRTLIPAAGLLGSGVAAWASLRSDVVASEERIAAQAAAVQEMRAALAAHMAADSDRLERLAEQGAAQREALARLESTLVAVRERLQEVAHALRRR